MNTQIDLLTGGASTRPPKSKPRNKLDRDKRHRENRKADPVRTAKRRALAKRLKAKYRRQAGAQSFEHIAKRAAVRRLIKLLRRRVNQLRRAEQRSLASSEAEITRKRTHVANRHRLRYSADPRYAIYHRVKRNIRKHLIDGKASRNWSAALGWTMDELKAHLERQFKGRMSWRNQGKWHIDHIRPVASFSFTCVDDPQFRECYALTNLRPMWGPDNMRKRDARLYLL